MGRAFRFTPAVEGAPEIEVVPDVVRGPRVLVAGHRLPVTRDHGRPAHAVPMADGTTRPLRLVGGFLGLRARFEGAEYAVEPRLRFWETFLVVLPLAILALGLEAPRLTGTVVAALVTGVAVGLALVVVRSDRPAWQRAALAIVVTIVGYAVVWAGIASV